MSHELVLRFREHGLPLRSALEAMLDESAEHRTDRRGCGFTQATRFLSTHVNASGDSVATTDLEVFDDWPHRETGFAAAALVATGWSPGWRRLQEAPAGLVEGVRQRVPVPEVIVSLGTRVRSAAAALVLPESRAFVELLRQVLERDHDSGPFVPAMPEKPKIGSCSQAEEFFFEIAHARIRRGGRINIFVDAAGEAVMLEKMNLGESHSAIVLRPVCINGIQLPAGSLCALAHHLDDAMARPTAHGSCLPLDAIAQARFLRLTTLSMDPADRARTFSAQVDAQLRANMFSPVSTTLDDLRAFARSELRSRR